jgi:hypothetical protein
MRRVLVIDAGLVVDGCEVVEGGVATLAVIEDLDKAEHRRAQPRSGGPVAAAEEFAFQVAK